MIADIFEASDHFAQYLWRKMCWQFEQKKVGMAATDIELVADASQDV